MAACCSQACADTAQKMLNALDFIASATYIFFRIMDLYMHHVGNIQVTPNCNGDVGNHCKQFFFGSAYTK